VYFHVNQEGTRVIDSDSQVAQFVPELLKAPARGEASSPQDGTFEEGLHVLNMEDVRQEEREKIEQEASETAAQALEQARQEAEAIIESARREADEIRQNAYEEGKQEGLAEGQALAAGQMDELKENFRQEMAEREKQIQQQEQALEPQFAEITASLVEKITGVLCQDKKDTIVYLIHQALKQLERTERVTIRVSKDDILLVSGQKEELKQCLAEGVAFDVMEDESLEANQCIIETDSKMIDCSLDVQLQNVKEQIRMLTIL
jgi:flagellar assembly protein FliH